MILSSHPQTGLPSWSVQTQSDPPNSGHTPPLPQNEDCQCQGKWVIQFCSSALLSLHTHTHTLTLRPLVSDIEGVTVHQTGGCLRNSISIGPESSDTVLAPVHSLPTKLGSPILGSLLFGRVSYLVHFFPKSDVAIGGHKPKSCHFSENRK